MAIQQFTRPTRVRGDKFGVSERNPQGVDRPLIVKVREVVEDFKSRDYPDPKPVVFVDVVDLFGRNNDWNPTIYVGPLWGGAALVDSLRPYVGQDAELPVMPKLVRSGSGRNYTVLVPLDESTWLDAAVKWLEMNPTAIDDARRAREAETGVQSAPPAQVTPQAPSVPPLQPIQRPAAPAAPAGNSPVWNAMEYGASTVNGGGPAPAAPAAQGGLPASPFPAPAGGAPSGDPAAVAAAMAALNAPRA
jgi:hypothetical protein